MFTKTGWEITGSAGAGTAIAAGVGIGAEMGTIRLENRRTRETITLELTGGGVLVGVGANGKGDISKATGAGADIALESFPSTSGIVYSTSGAPHQELRAFDFEGYALVGKLSGTIFAGIEGCGILFTSRWMHQVAWQDVKGVGLFGGTTLSTGAGATASLYQFSVNVTGADLMYTDQRLLNRCQQERLNNPEDFHNTCTFGAPTRNPGPVGVDVRTAMPKRALKPARRAF